MAAGEQLTPQDYLRSLRELEAPPTAASISALRHSPIRSVAWQVFLGAIPKPLSEGPPLALAPAACAAAHARREAYATLVATHLADPHAARRGVESLDPMLHNPLSTHESSAWPRFFAHADLQKLIEQDLLRLRPGDPYFAEASAQALLLRVLTIWALEHPALSYRQGMHELLAPLFAVRRADADRYCALRWQTSGWGAAEPDIAPILKGLDALLDSPHVEADAYALLDAVLSDGAAGRYYQPLAAPPPPGSAASGGAAGGAVAGGGGGGHSLGHAACWVQRQLVPAADAAVGEALAALRVEPTIYAVRWLRLLFAQELELAQTCALWDGLFAAAERPAADRRAAGLGPRLPLVEYVAAARVLAARAQLLAARKGGDQAAALAALLRPTQGDDAAVEQLLAHAAVLRGAAAAAAQLPRGGGGDASPPAPAAAGQPSAAPQPGCGSQHAPTAAPAAVSSPFLLNLKSAAAAAFAAPGWGAQLSAAAALPVAPALVVAAPAPTAPPLATALAARELAMAAHAAPLLSAAQPAELPPPTTAPPAPAAGATLAGAASRAPTCAAGAVERLDRAISLLEQEATVGTDARAVAALRNALADLAAVRCELVALRG